MLPRGLGRYRFVRPSPYHTGATMRIDRRFTTDGQNPYEGVRFASRDSRIVNPDGSAVFEAADVTMPADWSQVAVDIISKCPAT